MEMEAVQYLVFCHLSRVCGADGVDPSFLVDEVT